VGFVRKRNVFRLVFEDDHELAGLIVRVGHLNTGQLLDMTKTATLLGEVMSGGKMPTGDEVAAMNLMFDSFSEALVEWNLEREDGSAVPATMAGIREQDAAFILTLITAWMTAAGGVPDPLAGGSTSGETFPEASIPMEPLSVSP
jgi:hypothetical protein